MARPPPSSSAWALASGAGQSGGPGVMKAWCKFFMFHYPPTLLPPLPLPLPNHPRARGVPAPHAALALQHARTSTLPNQTPYIKRWRFPVSPCWPRPSSWWPPPGWPALRCERSGRAVGERGQGGRLLLNGAARLRAHAGGAARAPPPASPAAPTPSAFGARTGAPPLKERAETGA